MTHRTFEYNPKKPIIRPSLLYGHDRPKDIKTQTIEATIITDNTKRPDDLSMTKKSTPSFMKSTKLATTATQTDPTTTTIATVKYSKQSDLSMIRALLTGIDEQTIDLISKLLGEAREENEVNIRIGLCCIMK